MYNHFVTLENVMKKLFVCSLFGICMVTFADEPQEEEKKRFETIIDITQEISKATPCVPSKQSPDIYELDLSKSTLLNDNCYPHVISTPSFAGTCITAPSFFDGFWKSVNNIPLEEITMVPAVKIDLSGIIQEGGKITAEHIKAFEREFGDIRPKRFFIIYTGWSKNWSAEKRKYIKKYPILTKDAAEYIVSKKALGLGMDTPLPDAKDSDFQVQDILFSKGMYIVKNLSENTEKIKEKFGRVIIAPLKFDGSNESPARVIFYVPSESGTPIIDGIKKRFGKFFGIR